MYEVEQEPFPEEFQQAWSCAGKHLDRMAGPGLQWLRAWLTPPVAEHLAFRMGNQIIFIFVEVDDWWTFDPEANRVFLDVAREANAVPCLMPMQLRAGTYVPALPAWGLKHALTGHVVDPVALVSDERIEMTDWELHDLAVQIVRDQLHAQGKKLWSWQSALQIDPSLWFEDEEGPAWVVIRAARYPEREAAVPGNIEAIRDSLAQVTRRGFFASVAVANAEDPFDPAIGPVPLWRGHGMHVRFTGLQEV
jgi:hypothetical protein